MLRMVCFEGRILLGFAGFRFPKQRIPTVRWVAFLETPCENRIAIAVGNGLSKRSFVVAPRVDDGSVGTAEPEEDPESTEKLGAPPVTICWPERIAKLKFRGVRIAWNFDQDLSPRRV